MMSATNYWSAEHVAYAESIFAFQFMGDSRNKASIGLYASTACSSTPACSQPSCSTGSCSNTPACSIPCCSDR